MSSTRAVLQVFEKYQKDRVTFVQTVAELATRPQNIEPMQSAGVMALLRPLLLDNVPRCAERPEWKNEGEGRRLGPVVMSARAGVERGDVGVGVFARLSLGRCAWRGGLVSFVRF